MKTIIKRLELLEAARRAHAEAMVGLDYSEARRQLEERLDGIRARLGGGFEDWPTESRPDPVKVRQMIDEAIAETRARSSASASPSRSASR